MEIDGTFIEDTYAEAFTLRAARLIITADSLRWATIAAKTMIGFATSVIGCGCEAGLDGPDVARTPDGRPGVRVLLFARSAEALQDQLVRRVGQCVMTAATTACFDDLPSEETVRVGSVLRFFGDGHQVSKVLDAALAPPGAPPRPRRIWRIPVMDGEFVGEDRFGVRKGVAGGNFLILGATPEAALRAAERAARAIREVGNVILPFPGGIVRSGSKVGAKYRKMIASTNSPYCPTLRGSVASALPDGVAAVYEIVLDGLGVEEIERATAAGVRAACGPGVLRISAGNYGGRLGKHLIRLRPLLSRA
ncbi:MAG: formylmethanofuran--tetrahydromethanopterin N-formyltransferase [Acidobacteria bacterium]|nr:MAG: formylmethanofuran--tetrahydromethanopterin N-formyltransferase [Acidobacteriota bacterium]